MHTFPNGITANMVQAAENLFVAKALEATIRPVVEKYETDILQRLQFRTDKRYALHGIDRVVLDRKHTYLLSDQDMAVFLEESRIACIQAKLAVASPDNCPLLEAEHVRLKAESALLVAMSEHPNLGALKSYQSLTLENRAKAIELSLSLLAPFVRQSADLMQKMKEQVTTD